MDLYFSHVSPLDGKAFFLGEKLIFIKLEFPFIFIYFKKENKTLKNDSSFLEKRVFENPSLSLDVKLLIENILFR